MRARYLGDTQSDGEPAGKSSLGVGAEYVVLAMIAASSTDHLLMVVGDERIGPEWLPSSDFDLVSDDVPSTWRVRVGGAVASPGHIMVGPPSWLEPGFFEDYWGDGGTATAAARKTFDREVAIIVRES